MSGVALASHRVAACWLHRHRLRVRLQGAEPRHAAADAHRRDAAAHWRHGGGAAGTLAAACAPDRVRAGMRPRACHTALRGGPQAARRRCRRARACACCPRAALLLPLCCPVPLPLSPRWLPPPSPWPSAVLAGRRPLVPCAHRASGPASTHRQVRPPRLLCLPAWPVRSAACTSSCTRLLLGASTSPRLLLLFRTAPAPVAPAALLLLLLPSPLFVLPLQDCVPAWA